MIRAGLIFLAVAQGAAGLVQLFLPRTFYDDFPVPASPWVSLLPPYNEHLVRDVGALTLAYVLVLVAAAVRPEKRLGRVALSANLVWTVPHFLFHITHLGHYPTGAAVGQTVALAVAVLIPAALLALTWRTNGWPASQGVAVGSTRKGGHVATAETGQVTGTKDKDYNLIWFVEACLNNALRLETYIADAERDGDSELAEFFRKAQSESRKGAEQSKELLARRMSKN